MTDTTTMTTVRVGDHTVRVHLPEDVDGWLAAVAALDTLGVHKQVAAERVQVLAQLASEVVHPADQLVFTEVAAEGGEVNVAHAADVLTVFLDDYVRDVAAPLSASSRRPRTRPRGVSRKRRHWASWLPYVWRGVHERVAARYGMFWEPCPVCGRPFGGHEWRRVKGRPDALPVPGSLGEWSAICPRCTRNGYGATRHPDGPWTVGGGV
ncbi:hypothetical protein AB0F88_16760 [Streptosporangium sp. NPDC023963]|uniref:hypothetical protein n=1 Tax=Streptosporangium sp. NPDC023963 TaxID=3155608 RepID=UPI00342E6DA9